MHTEMTARIQEQSTHEPHTRDVDLLRSAVSAGSRDDCITACREFCATYGWTDFISVLGLEYSGSGVSAEVYVLRPDLVVKHVVAYDEAGAEYDDMLAPYNGNYVWCLICMQKPSADRPVVYAVQDLPDNEHAVVFCERLDELGAGCTHIMYDATRTKVRVAVGVEVNTDLHTANFMLRGEAIVINDPLAWVPRHVHRDAVLEAWDHPQYFKGERTVTAYRGWKA